MMARWQIVKTSEATKKQKTKMTTKTNKTKTTTKQAEGAGVEKANN